MAWTRGPRRLVAIVRPEPRGELGKARLTLLFWERADELEIIRNQHLSLGGIPCIFDGGPKHVYRLRIGSRGRDGCILVETAKGRIACSFVELSHYF